MPSERAGAETASISAAEAAEATECDLSAGAERDDDDATDTIEWGPVTHDRIRSLIVGSGLTVGLVGAVVGASAVAGVGSSLGSGSLGAAVSSLAAVGPGEAFVGVSFVLLLALLVVPYLYVFYTDWEFWPGSCDDRLSRLASLRPRWLLAGAAAPVVAWLFGPDWTALSGRLLLAWIWVVPFALLWRGVTVELDPQSRAIRRGYPTQDRSRTDDLDAVIRTRRIDLPRVGTVFLLAYRGNAWYRSTPWLTVPRDRADSVESALDEILARSEGPTRASTPVRTMLALIGCSTLVLAAALSAAGEGGAAVALGLFSAPFTLLFLALAARL